MPRSRGKMRGSLLKHLFNEQSILPFLLVSLHTRDTGIIPLVSKLSPGQAAYQILAGYQDVKFVPAYIKGPSAVDPLVLAKAFFSQLGGSEIPAFLINVNNGGKHITGKEMMELAVAKLSNNLPESKPAVADSKTPPPPPPPPRQSPDNANLRQISPSRPENQTKIKENMLI